MNDTLRIGFTLAIVFGIFYLNDGKPKGPLTLTYEISLVIVGTVGMAIMSFLKPRQKHTDQPTPSDSLNLQPPNGQPSRPAWMGNAHANRRRLMIVLGVFALLMACAFLFVAWRRGDAP